MCKRVQIIYDGPKVCRILFFAMLIVMCQYHNIDTVRLYYPREAKSMCLELLRSSHLLDLDKHIDPGMIATNSQWNPKTMSCIDSNHRNMFLDFL